MICRYCFVSKFCTISSILGSLFSVPDLLVNLIRSIWIVCYKRFVFDPLLSSFHIVQCFVLLSVVLTSSGTVKIFHFTWINFSTMDVHVHCSFQLTKWFQFWYSFCSALCFVLNYFKLYFTVQMTFYRIAAPVHLNHSTLLRNIVITHRNIQCRWISSEIWKLYGFN